MHVVIEPTGLLIVDEVALGAEDEQGAEVDIAQECSNTLEDVPKVNVKPVARHDDIPALEPWTSGKCIDHGIDVSRCPVRQV